jgi:hypothetical protein
MKSAAATVTAASALLPVAADPPQIAKVRAFVWMHGVCAQWSSFYSIVVSVLQCVFAYTGGALGSSALGSADQAAITIAGTVCTFVVGLISTFVKMTCCNFDANAAAHQATLTAWNALWVTLEAVPPPDPHAADAEFARLESISEASLPLWVRRKCARAWGAGTVLPDMCHDAGK